MFRSKSMTSKILLNYAFTFIVINLADSASMVIDGLITSRNLGATLLAATGLGDASYEMVSLFCGIFAVGLQATCSGALGIGDSKKASRYFTSGVLVLAAVALVTTVMGFLCLDPLCRLFGADGSDKLLHDGLYQYMRGWFVGIPGFFAFTVLCPLVTLDGNKRLVTAMTVLQSALNICGDYFSVLHWRNDGLRAIYGIGFSSGIAFDIVSVFLLANFLRKRSAFRLSMGDFSLRAVREMIHIGLPKLTQCFSNLASPIVINRTVLAVGGACAMAAMSVKASVAGFFFVAGNGIAGSVQLLSQVFYSEKDKKALGETASVALRTVGVLCIGISALLFALSPLLAGLFLNAGTEEYRLTVTLLRCFSASLPLNALNSCVLSFLQGTRKILPAHLYIVSHRFLFPALSTAVLGRLFGTTGIAVAFPVSELLVLLTYAAIALSAGRGRERTDALLLLPENFGYDESLAFSVTTIDEVIGISEGIEEFCSSHGIDKERSVYSALCIEETAGNVVEHGFRMDNKKHCCDIRVMLEDGDVVMRIRDDCRYFNIKERYEVLKSKGKTSGIGIRLVYGIAKEANYISLLNTNTLIIRV